MFEACYNKVNTLDLINDTFIKGDIVLFKPTTFSSEPFRKGEIVSIEKDISLPDYFDSYYRVGIKTLFKTYVLETNVWFLKENIKRLNNEYR